MGHDMTGRPPKLYDQAIADRVCTTISTTSLSLRKICADKNLPSVDTILKWLRENDVFAAQYARAKVSQASVLADEILEISDEASRDFKIDADGNEIVDHEHIQRSKLRVDSRKWLASKLAPKIYGDRIHNEISGSLNVTASELDDDALAAIAAGSSK